MDFDRIQADARELVAHNRKLAKEIEPTLNYRITEPNKTRLTEIAATTTRILLTPMVGF